MRILFSVSSWTGHYYAMFPLGWALRAAGHEVRVLCRPGDRDDVVRAGLVPVPVLDGPDMLTGARLLNVLSSFSGTWPYPTPPPHPDSGEPVDDAFDLQSWLAGYWARATESSRAGTDAAVRYARDWQPDLVVHDQLSLDGPLVAAVLGVPQVMHLWGPVGPADSFGPVGGEEAGRPADPSDAFGRHGAGEFDHGRADLILDPCPGPLAAGLGKRVLPIRYVPYNGPGDDPGPGALPAPTGRRRVCVVWGRSATRTFGPVANKLPEVVRAATDHGADVLLLARPDDAAAAGELPENVTAMCEVPMSLVLDGCDAVVHYGGAGSAMTALVAGLPQLSVPIGLDQDLVAARLAATGAACTVPGPIADVESIGNALAAVLEGPQHAEAAEKLAAAVAAMPPPAAVVADLESLVASRARAA
ncbi:nucleotide disphospho-sugar-binding domain-containing protein [Pseudonocardia endophytica]|uniref:UDP:flavonoid glycosyltransferase YjiC (YdhE family) n=1 Tax=Pseudonocardia endophytica TaxID=401976 RepID=A0A4R1HPN2_PSEEN|nr:nucleotide disphospho-sugar-binding domain-containing protein [Pseudonocardia endophytica]TCK24514.1 UDP:flavonoid glycosyltransferase YjiC (YdhE family) [Pseudonocardia endophytica]